MEREQHKRGIVSILAMLITLALCGAFILNLLFIGGILPSWVIWLGLCAVAFASVSINIASVAKRNRREEDNIATIPKAVAIAVVTIAVIWLLTFIIALAKL